MLLKRAQEFDLQTVDGILGKAKVVFEANRKVHHKEVTREQFDSFCKALDLPKGSQRRKWQKIGEMARRFDDEDIKLRLPISWTTLYALAAIETDKEFRKLVETGKLSRLMTGKIVKDIVSGRWWHSKARRHLEPGMLIFSFTFQHH